MSTTQYIGARYVPIFADPAEWNNTRTYEPLTIVMHDGNSYTSRQYVPKGIDISNDDFWALTGNYNAQVEAYRQDVERYAKQVNEVTAALNLEAERAKEAEAALQTNIDAEAERAKTMEEAISVIDEKIDGIITPEMFGAVGDGVTDDTEAVQAALDSVNDKTILLLRSMYGISKRLTANRPSTKIIALASSYNAPGFYALNNDIDVMLYVTRHGLHMNRVTFQMNAIKNTTIGVEFMISYYATPTMNANTDAGLINCSFANTDIGVKVRGRNVHFNQCGFSQNRIGIYIEQSDAEMLECRNTVIENCSFHTCGEFETEGGAGYGVFSDTSKALTEYTPNNVIIRNCFINFCNNFYFGWQFAEIMNCVFAHFRPKGTANYIAKVVSKSSNRFNENFVFTNNVYVVGSIADTQLTRCLYLDHILGAYIANNELNSETDDTTEMIFGTGCKQVIISNNHFNNKTSQIAHNMVSSTGLSNGNIARVYNAYNFNGLTSGVNYPTSS